MATNPHNLNLLGLRQGREVPDPLQTQAPNLAFPTSVPFVAPPDVIPNNLGDIQRFHPLNQLAAALGTGGVGLGSAANRYLAAREKKRQEEEQKENNRQYSLGLIDATSRAAKTRDIYGDLTQKGWLPANQNPFFQLGYQVQLNSELASQYRSELVQARLQNPGVSPQELQDQIKQRYVGLLQGARPEVAAKFFIEPSLQADQDDIKQFDKFNSDNFQAEVKRSVGADFNSLLDAELIILERWPGTTARFNDNVKRKFEATLGNAYATGIPYAPLADSMFEIVSNRAALEGTLKQKLLVLDSIRDVMMPSGNRLLSDPVYLEKYRKERDGLIRQAAEEEKLNQETTQLEIQNNTNLATNQIAEDAANGKLQDLASYLKSNQDAPVDYSKISSFYGSLNSNVDSLPEQQENKSSVDIQTDLDAGISPGDFLEKWGPSATRGEISREQLTSGIRTARELQDRRERDAKPRNWPVSWAKEYTKTILPNVTPQVARWAQYRGIGSYEQAKKAIPEALQLKWQNRLIKEVDLWVEQNPQATDAQVRNFIEQTWSNKLKPQIDKDLTKLKEQRGLYTDILNGAPDTGGPPPSKAPKALDATTYQNLFGWATDQQQFQIEAKLWQYKRGEIYTWMKSSLERKGKGHLMDTVWRQQTPESILELLRSNGYPVFQQQQQGTTPKAPGEKTQQSPPKLPAAASTLSPGAKATPSNKPPSGSSGGESWPFKTPKMSPAPAPQAKPSSPPGQAKPITRPAPKSVRELLDTRLQAKPSSPSAKLSSPVGKPQAPTQKAPGKQQPPTESWPYKIPTNSPIAPKKAPVTKGGKAVSTKDTRPANQAKYEPTARAKAKQYGVDQEVLVRLLTKETTTWDPKAVSEAGAKGLGQFMAPTAKQYGVNVNDPISSIDGAARYLRDLKAQFNGDIRKAVAAYNAGPGAVARAVKKYGGQWLTHLPAQTRNYVQTILGDR